ncbi:DUF3500 domain-containing protein [Nocardioides acrostichi]|uniref:DUF3500 domain-containing protein n=1 Tax=Nocardioides acrostichi TaxID=2784339 RepID=A0A930V4E2_9ACTN|nr:DUF3500 domain-containing protein [Nocardioides acrostichi]MBF4163636.1 DUF3500 domain-containing protein [Nocardioides acrostichi]
MTTRLLRCVPLAVATVLLGATGHALAAASSTGATTGAASSGASSTTAAVVEAADAFIDSLSSAQVQTLTYDYDDSAKSAWSNLPVGSGRNGLKLGDLTSTQRELALDVVAAELSDQGYAQEEQIRLADDNLKSAGGNGYGSGLYYLAFFGTPSTSSPFFVQFGGHHMAINADFDGDAVAVTPEFIGVEPQTFTAANSSYSPLAGEKSAVFALLDSLDSTQLGQAKISGTFSDVVKGANTDSTAYPADQGVLVSSLSSAQQDLVTGVIEQWVDDFPDDVADDYLAAYESAYDQTYVGWGNTTDPTGKAYVRVSGPRVWIEYIHQAGVVYSNQVHQHTVFRDKSYDYLAGESTSTPSVTSQTSLSAPGGTYGDPGTATVSVVAADDSTPTGDVSLLDEDDAVLATGTLSSGSVTLDLPDTLSAGTHTLTAAYQGSDAVDASTSSAVPVSIAQRDSSIAARLAKARVARGHRATLVLTAGPASPAVSGRVLTKVDGRILRRVRVTADEAGSTLRIRLPKLAVGVHRVRAVLVPSSDFVGSRSALLRLRILSRRA